MPLSRSLRAFLLLLVLCAYQAQQHTHAQSSSPATVHVVALEVEGAVMPLGIDERHPRMTWQLDSSARGVLQADRQVLVATRPDLLQPGRADVWDSGIIRSAQPWVVYAGPALRSRTRYHWTVRVTTSVGSAPWARAAWFETALLAADDWKGQWIAGPERKGPLTEQEGMADDAAIRAAQEFCRPVAWLTSGFAAKAKKNNQGACRELRPAPMFRKSFVIGKPVARARLYASGLAYADLAINGQATSSRQLEPGFTDYEKTVLYTTDDVTRLLAKGPNVLSLVLGSGHFDDAARTWDWGWEDAEWRATPRARVDLHIVYVDGSEQIVASDATWKVSTDGPTRFDSYYLGETFDARREIPGWRDTAFDDSSWPAARVVPAPAGVMRAEAHEPIRIVQRRESGLRSEPKPGIVVYDVGQNLTGWVDVAIEAPPGTPVEIFYSEKLAKDGTATTDGNALVYGQLQTDYYVARGSGAERWSPRFSYKGFQYVQLSAPDAQPLPAGVRVSVEGVSQVRTALARTSELGLSQPTLARIHGNTRWAIESNVHGIITDTPVYEKNGWTGDAQMTAGTASLLFDTERLYRKMFQDMADAQTLEGEVPLLSPSNRNYGYVGKPSFKPVDCCGATPAWDAFWFVLPWESYVRHGDIRALERTYPLMTKYLDAWVPRWTDKDKDAYAYTLTSGLGDWLPPEGVLTINALVSTAFYAHMAHIAADTARALKDEAGAAKYDALFGRIRTDFNARFFSPDGVYREKPDEPFLQTAQILPLAFGLVPDAQRTAVAGRLADDIVKHRGGHAYVGVIGATYVLPVLTATGHHDVAFTVATQTSEPSWGFWTDALKFTALGESWPADTRSRNHHFFGAIVQWMYEDLAGIRPIEPGFAAIEYAPHVPPSGLDHVSATVQSVRGLVKSAWMRGPAGLTFTIVVPPNARGRVWLPTSDRGAVRVDRSGTLVPLAGTEGVTIAEVSNGRLRVEVGSGEYRFVVAAR